MALTFTGIGTANASSGASPMAMTTTATLNVGDWCVVMFAYDNSGTSGADPQTGTFTVTPASGSFAGTGSIQSGTNDPGNASAGLVVRCNAYQVTSTIASGSTINLSWTGTIVARAALLGKVNASVGTLGFVSNSGLTGTNQVGTATPTFTTPSVSSGQLVVCWVGCEWGANLTGDADTTNGSWGTMYTVANAPASATGMSAGLQAKVVTATATQTFNPTNGGNSTDWILGALIFSETILPLFTQEAYQFYADGTETGSASLAAINTPVFLDDSGGNVNFLLRIRVVYTSAGTVASTDDWRIQWDKNATGSWSSVLAGINIIGFASANLTEGEATTNRLGAGSSGSFVAGKATEDGQVDDLTWSVPDYTEFLYALTLVAADVSPGDVITFRMNRNGSPNGFTYSVTPTLTVGAAPGGTLMFIVPSNRIRHILVR